MDITQARIAGTSVFFVAVFASGFWLSQAGRPLNSVILTVHKLIGLAALVFLGVIVYRVNQDAGLDAKQIAAAVTVGLVFAGTIITGGVLSIDADSAPASVLLLHRVLSVLTVITASGALFLLLGQD